MPAKKTFRPSEWTKNGRGCGDFFAREPKRSPTVCSVRSRSQQKSFLFLLGEKIDRAQIKKTEKTFLLAGERQRAAGWSGQFLSK